MIAHHQMMKQEDDAPEGMFEWEINEFLGKDGEISSPMFKLSKCNWFLYHTDRHDNCSMCQEVHHVGLYKSSHPRIIKSEKTLYQLSLINRQGEDFLTASGTIFPNNNNIVMMVYPSSNLELHSFDLLVKGTLAFRLLWKPWTDESGLKQDSWTITEKEPIKFLKTLSADFSHFYDSKIDTDFVLRVGDTTIPVHRAVLSARSEVFAAMLHHDTSENQSGVVDILDVDAVVLSDVLHYVYSGQIRGLSINTAAPMYIVADRYALIQLRDVCLDFLIHNLNIENICDAANLAHMHGELKLEEKIVLFMEDKLEEIQESDQWKELSKSKPSLVIKLLHSALIASKNKFKMLALK